MTTEAPDDDEAEGADSVAPAGGADVSRPALAAAKKAATRARVTVTRARVPGAAC
jgi:hypothetical protein